MLPISYSTGITAHPPQVGYRPSHAGAFPFGAMPGVQMGGGARHSLLDQLTGMTGSNNLQNATNLAAQFSPQYSQMLLASQGAKSSQGIANYGLGLDQQQFGRQQQLNRMNFLQSLLPQLMGGGQGMQGGYGGMG